MGVETEYYVPTIGADISTRLRDNTSLIFTESPGSQTFEVQDIPAICTIARARNIKTAIDNTWASPLYFDPFSHGLDLSVQAQIVDLLRDLQRRHQLAYLFISHDLSVVKNVSDRIIVMYLGKVCEIGNADELYERPRHPYTRALLASIPEPAPTVDVSEGDIEGELPSPITPPTGCRFNTRCQHTTDICFTEEPVMQQVGDADQYVACHHPVEVAVSVNG